MVCLARFEAVRMTFDNFNVNLHKNKGFLTYVPYIPIPEYGQSNAPLVACPLNESEAGDDLV